MSNRNANTLSSTREPLADLDRTVTVASVRRPGSVPTAAPLRTNDAPRGVESLAVLNHRFDAVN